MLNEFSRKIDLHAKRYNLIADRITKYHKELGVFNPVDGVEMVRYK